MASAATLEAPDPGRWKSLAVILAAAFLVGLDFFIVNVSIPAIRASLHATFAEVQLVIASYGLTYAVLLISGGRLGDIYGRKRMFIWGVTAFTAASLLCGIATSPVWLIAARALQGVAGALLFPQVLSIMQVTFPISERAKAFGLFGTVIGTSSFSGNVLGGLLVSANFLNLSWRPIFLINLPLGILTVLAAVEVREGIEIAKGAPARSGWSCTLNCRAGTAPLPFDSGSRGGMACLGFCIHGRLDPDAGCFRSFREARYPNSGARLWSN